MRTVTALAVVSGWTIYTEHSLCYVTALVSGYYLHSIRLFVLCHCPYFGKFLVL